MGHQKNTQIRPATPVATNAACHPQISASAGTTEGAMMAPMFEPELKMPVASARSFFGNHSATVLIDAGKFPDSPMPSANRAAAKPKTECAKACDAAARDHIVSDIV